MAKERQTPWPVNTTAHDFPASDMIRSLLCHMGSSIKDNDKSSSLLNQFYFVSNAYHAGVQNLMRKVDNSQAAEWTFFDQYTVAIPHLERVLLDFSLQDIDYRPQLLPPTDGVATALGFIEKWDSDRNVLNTAWTALSHEDLLVLVTSDVDADLFMTPDSNPGDLQILRSGLSSLDDDFYYHPSSLSETLEYFTSAYDAARTTDDILIISALDEYFRTSPLKDPDIIQLPADRLVSDVRVELSRIKSLTTNIWLMDPADCNQVYDAGLHSFFSAHIIKAISRLERLHEEQHVGKICQHLTLGHGSTLAALEDEWATVAKVLLDLSKPNTGTSNQSLMLLRLVANIRRPFHGRSAELTKMLHYLGVASMRSKDEGITNWHNSLKDVMTKSIESFIVAQKLVSDVKAIHLTAEEYRNQDLEFRKILKEIQPLFALLHLESEWRDRERAYEAAVKIDEEHLTMMRRRLGLA